MNNWQKRKLGDVIAIKHGYAYKGQYFSDQVTKYILLTPGNFAIGGGFQNNKPKYYNGPLPEEYTLSSGELVVTMTDLSKEGDTLGFSAIIPCKSKSVFLHNQRIGLVTAKTKDIDMTFMSYLMRTTAYQRFVVSTSSGATVKHTSPSRIYEYETIFPDIKTQTRIADILSAYDDLIENNQRRIKILEQMARALYRQWFVDFRFPGYENAQFVDSPLGKIPEGWEVKAFGELYSTSSGGTPNRGSDGYYNGDISWIKSKELNDGFILDSEEKITELGLKKSSAKMFPKDSVIIAIYGATIGKLGILTKPSATNQACVAVLPKGEIYGRSFAFFTLLEKRAELINLAQGAAQQNISQVVIKMFPVISPNNKIVKEFEQIITTIHDGALNLQRKNANLRRTRDLLLPRLLSGQLDVSTLRKEPLP